ncbi:MAG: FMN-binding protein [Coriobacteriales bacterium]|jgi:uncharacterized protein with FMN-binding domain
MRGIRTAGVVGAAALVVSLAGLGLAGPAATTQGLAEEAAGAAQEATAETDAVQDAQSGPTGSGEAAGAEQLAQTTQDPWDTQWALVSGSSKADTSAEGVSYADGIYTGTGLGMDGKITVTLRIEDGHITCTRIEQGGETQSVGGFEAIRDGVFAAMIDRTQGSDIDAIAGATITSAGVSMAVDDALAKAVSGASQASDGTATASAGSAMGEKATTDASSMTDTSAAADAAKA